MGFLCNNHHIRLYTLFVYELQPFLIYIFINDVAEKYIIIIYEIIFYLLSKSIKGFKRVKNVGLYSSKLSQIKIFLTQTL